MKWILLQVILIFLIIGTAFSQHTEDFEDEIGGATSFTLNGVNFTITGDLIIGARGDAGCNQSAKYLDSGWGDGGSSLSFGSIKTTDILNDKFTVSTTLPWCILLSANDGDNGASGDIKFVGTLSNGETIEESFFVDHPLGSSFDDFLFSSNIWEHKELTMLEIVQVFPFINYISLDNIVFENILTTNIANTEEERIKICPNPTKDVIEISGINNVEIIIIDALGRTVKKQSVLNRKIDISDLPNGVYVVSISTYNLHISKQIIKQ